MAQEGSILSAQNLDAVRLHLESVGYVAVLHWHLFGASHPTPLAFSDFDEFCGYLSGSTKPGDAIDVFPFPADDVGWIARGKIPEADGTIFQGGAY
jgi:hypothetical protein